MSFFIQTVDIRGTENDVSGLQESEASGRNGLLIKILKTLKIKSGYWFLPKRDQQDCNNYWPISFLLHVGKVIEKFIHGHHFEFFNNYCHCSYQFGVINHYPTNHAVISITEKKWKAIDDGKIACEAFLDFRKAFDTKNHDIVLAKLQHHGIRDVPLKLF